MINLENILMLIAQIYYLTLNARELMHPMCFDLSGFRVPRVARILCVSRFIVHYITCRLLQSRASCGGLFLFQTSSLGYLSKHLRLQTQRLANINHDHLI